MMGYLKKIFIIITIILIAGIYLLFSINKRQNVALNKQVIGTVKGLKILTDGIIEKQNYVEIKDFQKMDQYFIVVLGQAKYVNSTKLYWVKGFEPSSYKIEVSKSLFEWEEIGIFKLKKSIEKKDILITENNLKNKACFFVKVSIIEPKNDTVRISEVELFPETAIKLKIKSQKANNIKEHSADIIFYTSIPATGYLRFGDSENNLNQNIGMEMDVFTEHKIHVSSLLKGTKYYFQPVIRDLNNNLVLGKVVQFKTKGIPLPKYINIQVKNTKIFETGLEWNLNVPCESELFMGTSKGNLKTYYHNTQLQKENIIKINKLVPETEFYFKIISKDKFNNKTEKSGNFITGSDNMALNKKAYGSFCHAAEASGAKFDLRYLKKITDGIYDLSGNVGSGNIKEKGQAAIIDLKKKINIRDIKIIWRGIAYPRQFNVSIGNDMKNWKLIKSKLDSKKDGKRILSKGSHGLFLKSVTVNVKGIKARYVKIGVPKGAEVGSDLPFDTKPFLQLAEIEVFKVPDYKPPKYAIKKIK